MSELKDVGIVNCPRKGEVHVGLGLSGLIGISLHEVYYMMPGDSWEKLKEVRVKTSQQAMDEVENFLKILRYL